MDKKPMLAGPIPPPPPSPWSCSRQTTSSTTSMPLHCDPRSDELVVGTSIRKEWPSSVPTGRRLPGLEVRFPRPRPDQQVPVASSLGLGQHGDPPLYVAVEKQCCLGSSTGDSVSLSTTKITAPISDVAWPPPRHPILQPPCMSHGSHEAAAPDMVPGVDRRLYAESAP